MDPNSVIAISAVITTLATITYVVLTILLWRQTKRAADAAKIAAEAAKLSSDVAANLHRPFMGLQNVRIQVGGHGADLWSIAFALKNFGTLPALKVGLSMDFFVKDHHFAQFAEPASVQVFPSAEFESITHQNILNRVQVQVGNEKLLIRVRIPYQAENGREFEYVAQVSYDHHRNKFGVDKSETRSV